MQQTEVAGLIPNWIRRLLVCEGTSSTLQEALGGFACKRIDAKSLKDHEVSPAYSGQLVGALRTARDLTSQSKERRFLSDDKGRPMFPGGLLTGWPEIRTLRLLCDLLLDVYNPMNSSSTECGFFGIELKLKDKTENWQQEGAALSAGPSPTWSPESLSVSFPQHCIKPS